MSNDEGKEIGNNCRRGGHLSADVSTMQAKDALAHGTLGQPAGKADVDTGPGRKGGKFAELPSYSQ